MLSVKPFLVDKNQPSPATTRVGRKRHVLGALELVELLAAPVGVVDVGGRLTGVDGRRPLEPVQGLQPTFVRLEVQTLLDPPLHATRGIEGTEGEEAVERSVDALSRVVAQAAIPQAEVDLVTDDLAIDLADRHLLGANAPLHGIVAVEAAADVLGRERAHRWLVALVLVDRTQRLDERVLVAIQVPVRRGRHEQSRLARGESQRAGDFVRLLEIAIHGHLAALLIAEYDSIRHFYPPGMNGDGC